MSFSPGTGSISGSTDAVISSPQNQDVLTYESSTNKWKNKVPTGGTDATTGAKGIVQLAGDLGGTAALPTVPGLAAKAPLASPTFTGTVSGVTKTHVGLANVDNTSDANKPVSTAQQTALNLKANLASPTFTGTVSGITKTHVGLANVDNTSDASKPVSTAQQTALNLKANLASPTFTGTVSGITATMVGLGSVNNTSDASKPVSTATQTALDLKSDISATVALTGAQTVAGVKTFSSSPIVPTPTTSTQAANKSYVDSAQGNGPLATVRSASYTAANNEFGLCNATSGPLNVTLPTPTNGARVRILKTDASANAVTAIGNATPTLNGGTSYAMSIRWMSQDFAADGTSWYCV